MATTDVLAGAIALIERGYCIGPNAVDAKGVAVKPCSRAALRARRSLRSPISRLRSRMTLAGSSMVPLPPPAGWGRGSPSSTGNTAAKPAEVLAL